MSFLFVSSVTYNVLFVTQEQAEVVDNLSTRLSSSTLNPQSLPKDIASVIVLLEPLWAMLPSPEGRASKLGVRSPTKGGAAHFNSPTSLNGTQSLSDLDVRALKTLYDPRSAMSHRSKTEPFTIEAFAVRVQALITDDRALIERLTRFAQSHELLKNNAERAQKLAQESSLALETYQKQVKTLQERNANMDFR